MFGVFGENGLILQHKTNNNMELATEIKKERIPLVKAWARLFYSSMEFGPDLGMDQETRSIKLEEDTYYFEPKFNILFDRMTYPNGKTVYNKWLFLTLFNTWGFNVKVKEEEFADKSGFYHEWTWQIFFIKIHYKNFAFHDFSERKVMQAVRRSQAKSEGNR